jgi:sugar phosphate isomerase/epimerase
MTLEDCFMEMRDMGAYGLEILANGHIEGYPYPTDEWCLKWEGLCKTYGIVPVEYGHWVDSRLFKGRELTAEEAYTQLARDIRLAHKLGFTVLRTKLGVIDDTLSPVGNWREFIKMALPLAEECNVCMCPEIHIPTALKSKMVDEYVEFIEKENTKYFGINVDFGTFQNVFGAGWRMPGLPEDGSPASYPEDMIPLLKYIKCCHAKFNNMDENFEETTIPYKEIIKVFVDNGWDGYILSEYEGAHKDEEGYVSEQLRRQHIMMKRILGY